MPDDVNLVIRYTDNTVPFDIDIKDLASKIKVSIYQGNIQAESISGPVDLRTDRGNITVLFSEIQQDEPMDVYCRNGDVDITLSKEEPVTFKMRSQAGDIYTDLLIEEAEAEDTLFYEGLSIGSKDGKDLWTYRLDPAKSVEMLSYDGIESITVDKDSGRIVITNKQSGQDMQDKIYDFDGYTGNDTTNIYFHYDKVLSLKRSADEWNFIIGQPSYDFKGHLNGGGVEFGIRTGEGNIYLRSIR